MRLLFSSFTSWLPGELSPGWQLIFFGCLGVLASIGLVHVLRCWQLSARLKAAWQWLNSPTNEGERLGENIHYLIVMYLTIGAGILILLLVGWAIGTALDLIKS